MIPEFKLFFVLFYLCRAPIIHVDNSLIGYFSNFPSMVNKGSFISKYMHIHLYGIFCCTIHVRPKRLKYVIRDHVVPGLPVAGNAAHVVGSAHAYCP